MHQPVIEMVVDKPSFEIKAECASEDIKRVLGSMVRSHNDHIAGRVKQIREDIAFNKEFKIPRSFDFTDAMTDRITELLIEQKLMEDLQDYFDDLPTCVEFHHG